MNISRFTQKSLEAVRQLEKTAYDFGNQEVTQEHLLYVLLTQEDSLILKLFEKMGVSGETFTGAVGELLNAKVKVQGGQPYIGADLNEVLVKAEDEDKSMGDDYVSVEHLLLTMLKHPNPAVKGLFKRFGIDREGFLKALSAVRGNQKVTTDNPEAT